MTLEQLEKRANKDGLTIRKNSHGNFIVDDIDSEGLYDDGGGLFEEFQTLEEVKQYFDELDSFVGEEDKPYCA